MRRLLLLFLIIPLCVSAQTDYNSDLFWSKLVREKTIPVLSNETDTAIIVFSNRATSNDSLRFMSEIPGNSLHCFFIYTKRGKWHVVNMKSLSEILPYLPDKNRDWVIFTGGMGRIFTSAIDRGLRLSATYRVNVIVMDYPSISSQYNGIRNYYFAIGNARNAYKDFLPALDTIKDLRLKNSLGPGRVNMLFHSMGNNILRELVSNDCLQELNDQVWIDHIILDAACVPQKHHEEWLGKIKFAKKKYVHYNPDDYVLWGATLISLHRQLGRCVKNQCEDVVYVNFNSIAGKGHSNFLTLPQRTPMQSAAYNHYNRLFHQDIVLKNDSLYRVISVSSIELLQ